MTNLSIQIIGLPELVSDMKKAGANARPLVNAALQNSSTIIQRNVRERAPHKTGDLQRAVLTQVNYPSASVSVNEEYGRYVEDGTKPHLILPSKKKALFWKGAVNPYKAIYHPGTKPKPFFKPGVEASETHIIDQFAKVMERLITIMAGR